MGRRDFDTLMRAKGRNFPILCCENYNGWASTATPQ
jgi:hypothetical protein